jgi:ATP-dependent Clp protease protease subunit
MATIITQDIDRKIFISEEITEKLAKEVITRIIEINDYDADQESTVLNYQREPIEMYINSRGGSCHDGLGIIDVMNLSDTPIISFGFGNILSMALLIFLSSDYRFSGENTRFMYHAISYGIHNDIQAHEDYLLDTKMLEERIDNIIVSKTNITKESLSNIRKSRKDYFFYSDEALENGVANEILKKTRIVEFKKDCSEDKVEEVDKSKE